MDRRDTASNGRVAHVSLEGQVEAESFIEGTVRRVTSPVTAILDEPGGRKERELVFGQPFRVLEDRDGTAFGFSEPDGYVGYIAAETLADLPEPTHRIDVRATRALSAPDIKVQGPATGLGLGALVSVTGDSGRWSEITLGQGTAFLPTAHLAPLGELATDPVSVAERLLGTPYAWGGNSADGIDCSGLVQIGCRLTGIDCPGDSDQQEERLGRALLADDPLRRGDLLFWKGHVAWVADPDTILHANAYAMAVAFEPLKDAIERIETQGDGPVTSRRRL
ncbi:NlpC/P60 family protein [Pelagovum pacificum]|uniref:NlpC/P60 family protein n=1 Tax=Pelagovum pacificum TaxID=2588711 RepID=A0A5C5GI44_9RHOB|nr:NlpC/P60 family protein [Pelagovum pacificum]QQA42961.1 C40 family peptidase [Pelagovum pacificum]TNY33894.1 NlpC/P60 family protein [Pelagovum pacificum]